MCIFLASTDPCTHSECLIVETIKSNFLQQSQMLTSFWALEVDESTDHFDGQQIQNCPQILEDKRNQVKAIKTKQMKKKIKKPVVQIEKKYLNFSQKSSIQSKQRQSKSPSTKSEGLR